MKIDDEKFEIWAHMIRSDQMTAAEVQKFLENNSDFASWYLSEKIRDAVSDEI